MAGRVAAVLAAVVGVLAGAMAPVGLGGAAAAPAVLAFDQALPFSRPLDLAVDPATGQVVVTGADAVSVRAADGTETGTLTALGATPDEVIVHEGTAYVLLPSLRTIVAVDMDTATETDRWALGGGGPMAGLATVAGRLWTTSANPETGEVQLLSLDPGTGAVVAGEPWSGTPMDLAASPTDPTLLGGVGIAVGPDAGDGVVRVIDVVTGEQAARPSVVPFAVDVTFSADGASIVVAAPYWPVVHEYVVPGLARGRITYPTGTFPSSVAVTDEAGGLLAIAGSSSSQGDDLSVFRHGVPAPVASLARPDDDSRFARGGVRFTPAGDAVLALVEWPGDPERSARLVRIPLAPEPGAPSPRVLGTAGGGRLELTGWALGRASAATVGGQPATVTWSAADRATVRAPALPAGPASVVVTNGAGLSGSTTVPASVIDLGPHGDAHAYADAMTRTFVRRSATDQQRDAEDARLLAGGEVGALPLALAGDPAHSRLRTPLIRLYQAVFLRPPDTAGLGYWLGRMERGQTIDSVAASFAGTPEFRARYGALSDGAFVDQVYVNVLGRRADSAGRTYWVDQLRRGVSRGRVILLVSGSAEFRDRTADQVALINLSTGLLGRVLTPSEIAAALDRVATGGSLAAEATRMVRSAEHEEVAR